MDVAGRELIIQALTITRCAAHQRVDGVECNSKSEDDKERADRCKALQSVLETGRPYEPLIAKWKRK